MFINFVTLAGLWHAAFPACIVATCPPAESPDVCAADTEEHPDDGMLYQLGSPRSGSAERRKGKGRAVPFIEDDRAHAPASEALHDGADQRNVSGLELGKEAVLDTVASSQKSGPPSSSKSSKSGATVLVHTLPGQTGENTKTSSHIHTKISRTLLTAESKDGTTPNTSRELLDESSDAKATDVSGDSLHKPNAASSKSGATLLVRTLPDQTGENSKTSSHMHTKISRTLLTAESKDGTTPKTTRELSAKSSDAKATDLSGDSLHKPNAAPQPHQESDSIFQRGLAEAADLALHHAPQVASLLGMIRLDSSRDGGSGLDSTVALRLGIVILLPLLIAFGCLFSMMCGSSSKDENAQGDPHRSSKPGGFPFPQTGPQYGVRAHGIAAGVNRSLPSEMSKASQDSLARPFSSGIDTGVSRSVPSEMSRASRDLSSVGEPGLAPDGVSEFLQGVEPTDSPTGVTVAMPWGLQPHRQTMDVDITSVTGTDKDKVLMRALLHEFFDSCGVLLETFQGHPVAFLHTGNAVSEEGKEPPMHDRKVSVFAATSTSSISDTPVMIVYREEGPDGQPRILARRPPRAAALSDVDAAAAAAQGKGAAVFEVILDSSGQPTKVMQMDGCHIAEVVRPKQEGFRVLHITFGEDLWLGLAAVIAGRKLA